MKSFIISSILTLSLMGTFSPLNAGHDGKWKGKKGDHKEMVDHMVKRLTKKLDLSDEQQAGIRKIVEGKKQKMTELRKEFKEKMKALHTEIDIDITALLDADQKEKYEEHKEKQQEKKKRKKKKWKEGHHKKHNGDDDHEHGDHH